MGWVNRLAPATLALCVGMSIAGCAMAPPGWPGPSYLAKDAAADPKETPDPFEGMNRKIFASNADFNHALLYPAAKAYREQVPEGIRDRIDAFVTNLSEPMVFANTVLQLRPDAAATTLARFLTNSTVGLGGLYDVAASTGQPHQTGDVGQTLYVWGVRDTAYLVLPLLGPTTIRDGIGTGISLIVPAGIVSVVPAKLANVTSQVRTVDTAGAPVAGLGKVEMLQELEANSLDFYATLRSVSDQKRQAELQQALAQSVLFTAPSAPAAHPRSTYDDPSRVALGAHDTLEPPRPVGAQEEPVGALAAGAAQRAGAWRTVTSSPSP
jgi:phospholipid-binding lipoprotein MlaA